MLDIGCGAGRVSLHLQERGLEVVAIDASPGAVEVARRRGVRDARVLDLTDVGPELGHFDTILLLRNNFGLTGPRRAPAALRRLSRVARPGAVLVTDSVDPRREERDDLRSDGASAVRIRRALGRPGDAVVHVPDAAAPRDGGGRRAGRLARAATRP